MYLDVLSQSHGMQRKATNKTLVFYICQMLEHLTRVTLAGFSLPTVFKSEFFLRSANLHVERTGPQSDTSVSKGRTVQAVEHSARERCSPEGTITNSS